MKGNKKDNNYGGDQMKPPDKPSDRQGASNIKEKETNQLRSHLRSYPRSYPRNSRSHLRSYLRNLQIGEMWKMWRISRGGTRTSRSYNRSRAIRISLIIGGLMIRKLRNRG